MRPTGVAVVALLLCAGATVCGAIELSESDKGEWKQVSAKVKTKVKLLEAGAEGAPVVEVRDEVTVHATGTVKESGKKFWSTKDAGQQPFEYSAGVGGVIKGWDQGCLGMRIGEKRLLDIPYHEGYGHGGFPAWGIPSKAGLLFEIEVLKIQGKPFDLKEEL